MDAPDIRPQLETVQGSLDAAMKSIQAAVMRLESAGPEVSDTLAALREAHRQLYHLDLRIVEALRSIGEVML